MVDFRQDDDGWHFVVVGDNGENVSDPFKTRKAAEAGFVAAVDKLADTGANMHFMFGGLLAEADKLR